MASKTSDRLRFKAVREATASARNTATGDLLGDYRGSTTGDVLKYFSAAGDKLKSVIVAVITGDTGNDAQIAVLRTQTIDQALSASGVATLDLITIASVDKVRGMLTYKDMGGMSQDIDPGQEIVFQTYSGAQASDRFACYVVVEPNDEDAGAVFPGRMNKSS